MTYDPRKGVQKVQTTSDLSNIVNPQDGDLVVTLDDDQIKKYDSTSAIWTSAVNNFIDPSQFGNWVLYKTYTLSNQSIDEVLTGDFDCKVKVVFEGNIPTAGALYVRPNSDVTQSHYYRSYLAVSGASITAADYSTNWTGLFLASASAVQSNELIVDLRKTGLNRLAKIESRTNLSQSITFYNAYWTNTTDLVTSLYISGSGSYTGTIKVYKWQEITPVEISSYQKIGKYTYTASTINTVFSIDSSVQDIYIVCNLLCTTGITSGQVCLRPNSDSTTTNYYCGYVQQSETTVSGGKENIAGMSLGTNTINMATTTRANFSTVNSNGYCMFSHTISYGISSQSSGGYSVLGSWKNNGATITSFQLYSTCSYTGTIEVYKLTKTHLLDTAVNRIQDISDLETSFDGPSLWDGKLAFALNQSQLVAYREDDQTWAYISRRDFTDKMYTTDATLYSYDYAMMNLSAIATLTFPSSPAIGDVIYVLDLPKNFHIYNCSINLNGLLCNGQSGTVILDTPGEYKFKYTGTTFGWRMMKYA